MEKNKWSILGQLLIYNEIDHFWQWQQLFWIAPYLVYDNHRESVLQILNNNWKMRNAQH